MSYQMRNDSRSRKSGRFVAKVQKEIQEAFIRSGMRQQQVAEKLGVNRSIVNRRLTGGANLTLRSISDLAWALGEDVELRLLPKNQADGANEFMNSNDIVIGQVLTSPNTVRLENEIQNISESNQAIKVMTWTHI